MRVLMTGSSGQLGSKLVELLERERQHEVRATDIPSLDITRETDVQEAVRAFRPRWIVNCAAYTDVEKAEAEPDEAYRINCTAVRFLADAALECGARLLHVSTDYVFSGVQPRDPPRPYREDDPPGPISVYGASKLAGEVLLSSHAAPSLVVRTSWLYGGPGRNFLGTMLRLGREAMEGGKPVRVVQDQVGTPTDAWSLAAQIALLLRQDLSGTVHAACRGQASWFEFARAIFLQAGWDVPVEPIAASQYPTKARRPVFSALENFRLEEAGLQVMPHWKDGLEGALRRVLSRP